MEKIEVDRRSFLKHASANLHLNWPREPTVLNHAASPGRFVSAGSAGKVKWNVAPHPPQLAQIRPPCDSTIDLLIAKPMPLP
jgi:hypothetical protein